MTTETKPANTSNTNNQSVFAPLGKYAVVAVIMVSIIVTTAIMLDKQLNVIDKQILVIDNDVKNINKTDVVITDAADQTLNDVNTPIVENEIKIDTEETEKTVAEAKITTDQKKLTDTKANHNTKQDITTVIETTAMVTTESNNNSLENNKAKSTISNKQQSKDRFTFKLEQKQRMTDMFARIQALEAQQLNQYKINQGKQIARLRNQVTNQQELIETLILRNKDLFELRAANVQRNQTNREKILSRI